MEDQYIQTKRIDIKLEREYDNKSILDIGGGGEGFIGQLYGKNVIAIDKRQDELEESENDAIKLVMDGAILGFTDNNFEVVTLFYSLMYMSQITREKVLSEAFRVLKSGGVIEIWDSEVPKIKQDGKNVFVAQLNVECNDKITTVGFGIGLDEDDQTFEKTKEMLNNLGLTKIYENYSKPMFRLKYRKK